MTDTVMSDDRLDEIVAQIEQLTAQERRRLMRRLRVSGLLIPEEVMTDRRPLRVAPAVRERPLPAKPPAAPVPTDTSPAVQKQPEAGSEAYRSPVSGRVVVGSPQERGDEAAHVMSPLPGQAPEQPIRIIFDGGSKGNPGQGYGSYALEWPGNPRQIVQLRFGDLVTNNEAEYDTLIAALEGVLKRLREGGADPGTAKIDIRGDSLLVINQVKGEWKCNESRLRMRRDRVRALLKAFGAWQLRHHDREKSVEVLGH